MRQRFVWTGLGLAFLTAVVLFLFARDTTYDVRGQVVGFGGDSTTVFIAHEDIPGLMPAMTMPFRVRDPRELDDFALFEPVAFTLHLNRRDSWISSIRRLPDSTTLRIEGVPESVSAGTDPFTSVLRPGERAPDLTFTDQSGAERSLRAFEGNPLVLTFIYTRCPLPEYCPQLSRQFQTLERRIAAEAPGEVALLSLTLDPAYDTPEVLRAYGLRYVESFDDWTFGTGTPEQMANWTDVFGVTALRSGAEIDHNLVTALLGPDGRLIERWRGTDWRVDDVWGRVREVRASGGASQTR